MRDLFARYGGHGFIIGKGRASALNLPEDQSLDNMLDHHSVEIIPNLYYISSYTLRPEFMGAMPELPHILGDQVNHIFPHSAPSDGRSRHNQRSLRLEIFGNNKFRLHLLRTCV